MKKQLHIVIAACSGCLKNFVAKAIAHLKKAHYYEVAANSAENNNVIPPQNNQQKAFAEICDAAFKSDAQTVVVNFPYFLYDVAVANIKSICEEAVSHNYDVAFHFVLQKEARSFPSDSKKTIAIAANNRCGDMIVWLDESIKKIQSREKAIAFYEKRGITPAIGILEPSQHLYIALQEIEHANADIASYPFDFLQNAELAKIMANIAAILDKKALPQEKDDPQKEEDVAERSPIEEQPQPPAPPHPKKHTQTPPNYAELAKKAEAEVLDAMKKAYAHRSHRQGENR